MAPPIVQYWHSQTIPTDVAALIASFRHGNPHMQHLLFNEATARDFIEKHFGSRETAAFDACAVPAMQADYFRYCAAIVHGGVYVDVDVQCVRPLDSLLGTRFEGVIFRGVLGMPTNNFFFFRTSHNPLLELTLDIATIGIERRVMEDVWFVTGPWIFTVLAALYTHGNFANAWRSFESLDAFPPHIRDAKALAQGARNHFAKLKARQPAMARVLTQAHADDRVGSAFEGIEVRSFKEAKHWIASPAKPLRYKFSNVHWPSWEASIFRS